MTIAQFIVAYSVCWWLVLFMLLPSGAQPAQNPAPGHAPSAPANPRLKRKAVWTTLFAIIPTLVIYFVATQAKAEESIYHARSKDCVLKNHVPSADLATQDGQGMGGKTVVSANLDNGNEAFAIGDIDIPLQIPSQNYIDRAAQSAPHTNTPTSIHGRNVDLSHSFIEAGKLTVKPDGKTLLNGKSISNNDYFTGDCYENK